MCFIYEYGIVQSTQYTFFYPLAINFYLGQNEVLRKKL